jgi:hypothetical protein
MAAPGWYDDPNAPGGKRWWDGTQWTDHVAAPAQPAAPQAPQPPATQQAPAAPAHQPTPPQPVGVRATPAEDGPYPPARIAVAAAAAFWAVLLIVGSIGTWVSVETTGPFHIGASRGGLDRDGAITLVLAILAIIVIAVWAVRIGPPVARIALAAVVVFFAALGVLIAIIDIADVTSSGTDIVDTSVGWGLWLCLVSSLLLGATMLLGLLLRPLR